MKDNTEQWYKTIFNNSRDAIFVMEFSKNGIGKFIDVNREACRSLGYSKKELLQLAPKDISDRSNGSVTPSFSKKRLAELILKKEYTFESVHITKRGRKFPVEINAFIIKFNGEFVIIASVRDISKFKQNEERIKKTEREYKKFLDLTFDGVYRLELQKPISIKQSTDKQVKAIFNTAVITECNDTYAKMYGYKSASEVIGKSLKSLYGYKLSSANYKHNASLIENGYSLKNIIYYGKTVEGKRKYFSNNVTGIVENGMLKGSWGTKSDITEIIEARNALQERDIKYRTIFEQSPLGLIHFNSKGEIIEVNESFVKMMGSTRQKLIGFSSLKHANDKVLRIAVKDMLTIGSAFYKGIYKSTTGNKITPMKIWLKGIRDKTGKIIGGTAILEDISRQVANEKKLQESEEKFRSIFEYSPLGLLHFNDKGEIIEANDRFIEIMGTSRGKLIGFNSLKNAADKKMRNAVKEMLTKGSAFYHGYYKSVTGKKTTYVKVWFKAIRDKNGKIMGGSSITEDISLQVESEKKLKLSEEKYHTIFNSISEGLFIHEKNTGRLLDANKVVLDMYGYTFGEILKIDVSKISENVVPYTKEKAFEYLRKANRKPQIFEWRARKKDNSLFWIEVNMRLGEVSGVQRIIITVRDITKRKKAEDELRSSELRYRNLIQTLTDPVIVHISGKFVFVNDAAVKLAGVKRNVDLIGKSLLQFVHPDYRAFAMKRMLNSGNILPVVEEKFLKADGSPIDVEVSGSRLLFHGKPAIQLVVRDISERKRREKIQTSLFKISQAAVNAVNLDQFLKEMHSIIKDLMPADNFYIALYNKEAGVLTFPYFVDEYDKVVPTGVEIGNGFTAYVLRTKKSLIINSKMKKKLLKAGKLELVGAKSKVWVGIVLKYKEEIIGVLAVQDYRNENAYGENEKQILTFVSEQIAQAIVKIRSDEMNRKYLREAEIAKGKIEHSAKQLYEVNNELRLSKEKLVQTNANKDKFFSILSHDLRSPFTALLGYAQLLEEAFDDLTEDEKILAISSLHKTARNIFELLTGLLEWSRTQTGRMEFAPEKLNMHSVAVETISILEMSAAAKHIKFVNRLNRRSFAVADRNMVRTILRNLLSNAVKFTEENGKVEVSGKTVKGFMQITVADSGIGIEKFDIDMLFKIEEHHTTLGTNHEAGTGVGLILCKELVEKNGGKIWVESKIGEGSKFIFTLKKN